MKPWKPLLGAGLMFALATPALHAQAIISNGAVRLGVNAEGHLNVLDPSVTPGTGLYSTSTTNYTGVRSNVTGNEATAPGCLCEGWGAGISGGTYNTTWGGANISTGGVVNLHNTVFTSTASTARSETTIRSGTTDVMRVVHEFRPSASPDLYQVVVTMTNLTGEVLGAGTDGLRYRRVMDWDVEPTPFSEYVTIYGNAATNLIGTSDNGFDSPNPFDGRESICAGAPVDADFVDSGPCDHGALFDFGFDALAVGGSQSFNIFYGVAAGEPGALAALAAVGAEVYSLGQCNPAVNPTCSQATGTPNTFVFGFSGVGGEPIPPPTTVAPEPGSMILLGSGLFGLIGYRRRRREEGAES